MRSVAIALSTLLTLFLVGCGQVYNHPSATEATHTVKRPDNSKYGGMTPIKWSSMTERARQSVRKVTARFGNPHLSVALTLRTNAVAPPYPLMYLMTLKGHFHYHQFRFDGLQFSVLGNGTQVWAFASNGNFIKGIPQTMRFSYPSRQPYYP